MTQPVPEEMLPDVPAPDAGRVAVRFPDGTVGTVPAGELDAAVHQGFAPMSDADVAKEQLRPEFETPEGIASSAIRGAARTASFGLYDPAVVGLTRIMKGDAAAEEQRRALDLSKEFNPTASAVGEIGGLFVKNPVVSGIGKAVGLAGKLLPAAESLGARTLQAGIRASAEGALVGGAYGAGEQISEDTLGDHETTAEKLWAASSKGALFGGVLGGGIGAAGQLVSEGAGYVSAKLRPHPAAVEADGLASSQAGVTGDLADFDQRLANATPKQEPLPAGIAQSNQGHADGLFERYVNGIAEPERKAALRMQYEARKSLTTADDMLQTTSRRATAAGDELMESVQETRLAFNGDNKAKKMVTLVDTADPARTLGATFAMVEGIEAKVAMLEEVAQGEGRIGIRNVREAIDAFNGRMKGTLKLGSTTLDEARAAFMFADRLKQAIGRSSGFGREAKIELQGEFSKLYDVVRGNLEDTSLWGKAGDAQRVMNKATTEMLETSIGARQAFIAADENVAGDIVLRANSDKMFSYLSKAGHAKNDSAKEAVERFVAGHEAQLDAAVGHWPLDAAEAAQIAKGKAAVAKFRSEMASAETQAAVTNKAKAMIAEEALMPTQGWMGLIADVKLAPMRHATRLADMQRTLNSIDKSIKEGVGGFLSGKAGAARAPLPTGEASRLADEARKLHANTPAMLERVSRVFTGVNEAAPKVATALAGKAIGSLTWLANRAPRDPTPMATFTPQFHRPAHSDAQLAAFGRAHQAFDNPLSVLEDMKNGAVTREGVEFLRDNSPKLYAQIQTQMMEQLALAKEPLPYEKRMQLGILFGIDADPTLNAAFIATMQKSKAEQTAAAAEPTASPARGASGRKGRKIDAGGYQTESERIAGS